MTPKIPKGVTIEVHTEQDDLEVRGNALACGDAAEDRAEEDRIIRELDRGNVWAWSRITVTARFGDFAGSDCLGGCSYPDETAFRADLYADMVAVACEDLQKNLETAVQKGTAARRALKELPAAQKCPVCGKPLPSAHRDRRISHNGLVVCDRASCEEQAGEESAHK